MVFGFSAPGLRRFGADAFDPVRKRGMGGKVRAKLVGRRSGFFQGGKKAASPQWIEAGRLGQGDRETIGAVLLFAGIALLNHLGE